MPEDNNLKEVEIFNAHQQDTRKRAEFLAKAVFLIGGGALTLSINLFLSTTAPKLSPAYVCILRNGWWALFISMMLFILVLSVMLMRDYAFGERWRKKVNGENVDVSGSPGWPDAVMWALGILGMASFFYGLGSLAWVSSALLGKGA